MPKKAKSSLLSVFMSFSSYFAEQTNSYYCQKVWNPNNNYGVAAICNWHFEGSKNECFFHP